VSDPIDAGCSELQDRYELVRQLDKGGMSDVYLAKRVTDGMLVAIKVLRPEFTRTMGRDMFHREIALLKNLKHPNILPLLESGEQRERLCFISPYAEGGSLAARFDDGRFVDLDGAIEIARPLAAALDYAHAQNVVHRDIKPGNVLFMEEQVVLCDFGVARAIIRSGGERLSSSGLLVGTPHYMSPEQASGVSKIDGRSDVYALACVVYEMLMGEPVFDGPSAAAVLRKHRAARPPSLRVVKPELPEYVESAVHAALEKQPKDRPATAGQFVELLEGQL
jgi:eukaryotic-like serine/threonine-protein kinase